MNKRWIVAAAVAIGVGVLTVPMLVGRTSKVEVTDPGTASTGPGCKSEGKANLDFTLKRMDGADVRLSDYKGKVVVINFWATWCAPCLTEIPGFIELYAQYKDQGLEILGLSPEDDAETMRAFADKWKINYPMLLANREDILDAYGPLIGYPTSFIVGRDGSVCGKHIGPAPKAEFEREIKALL
jgi:peroxiredoxin